MIEDLEVTDCGTEGTLHFALFDEDIDVLIEEDFEDIDYAQKCAAHLNSLSEEMIDKICRAAKAYCLYALKEWYDFDFDLSAEITEDTPVREILKCISPLCLSINCPKTDEIGYHIEFNCEWEPEHGMELTILGDELLYCGAFESINPWAWLKYHKGERDEYNFAIGI